MNILAKVIEDSISEDGIRLTTFQLCYPRFIHSEFMTHRVFSRNASSSRAIPVAKMIEQIRNDPAMPIHWGANQPGMQASAEVQHVGHAKDLWKLAANNAANVAESMMNIGLHKQVANRILEPFQWIHVIVTATEWDNFFELREHTDADPNIYALATIMKKALLSSVPTVCLNGNWHLPYITALERAEHPTEDLLKMSAARCARVSYLTHDGQQPDVKKDTALYDKLIVMKPMHASPIEHQATPDLLIATNNCYPEWGNAHLHGNFRGWCQNRKRIELS